MCVAHFSFYSLAISQPRNLANALFCYRARDPLHPHFALKSKCSTISMILCFMSLMIWALVESYRSATTRQTSSTTPTVQSLSAAATAAAAAAVAAAAAAGIYPPGVLPVVAALHIGGNIPMCGRLRDTIADLSLSQVLGSRVSADLKTN